MDDTEKDRLAALADAVERHERAIAELKLGVAGVMSGATERLDATEKRIMIHGKKLDNIVAETGAQTATLGELRSMICSHKDENHAKLLNVEAGVAVANESVEAIRGAVSDLGDTLVLVKNAVVHSAPQIWGKRAFYMVIAVAAIMVCLTMIIRPDSIPLFLKFLEAHSH